MFSSPSICTVSLFALQKSTMEHIVPSGYEAPPCETSASLASACEQDAKRERLDTYCVEIFDHVPTRKWAAKAIKRQQILLNNEPTDSSRYIQAGDIITCAHDTRIPPKLYEFKLTVLYEDEHLAGENVVCASYCHIPQSDDLCMQVR